MARPSTVVPATPRAFAEFGVSRPVIEALALRDIGGAFPIQALVLRDAIEGRDVLARSSTGSGKTLAFAIPIVERLSHDSGSPSALVLVPTRELASQVAEEDRAIADVKRLVLSTVYGGVGITPQGTRARATPTSSSLRPGDSSTSRGAGWCGSTPSGSASWTRRTGCSTWGSYRT